MRGLCTGVAVAMALMATAALARHGKSPPGFAEPGDIIAAEGDYTHLSATKGVRAAIRATAEVDAQIYTPHPMHVSDYAASSDPRLSAQWHTRQLWMSCDGSYAVTHGEWQRTPALGWYVTVWHRQKGGGYKWVLNESGPLTAQPASSDMISATIADCPVRRPHPDQSQPQAPGKPTQPDYASHRSDDGTMAWTTATGSGGSQTFLLQIKQDGLMHEVLHVTTAPPGN